MATEQTVDGVREILGDALGLGDAAMRFDPTTGLLGSIPEFDSMAVVGVVTGLEEHFGIEVHDDELDAATFETLGSLADFVETKLAG